jgi:hypothetical protein
MEEVDRGDLWVRCHGPFEKGFVYRGHRHWIDHNSYVHEGTEISVKYRYQQDSEVVKEVIYSGPCRFLVAAGLFHEIEVLSDEGKWDCEFAKPADDSPLKLVFNKELTY